MKTFVILLIAGGMGMALLIQKRHAHTAAAAPRAATEPAATREVSEHNWAKHSLDRAAKVAREAEQTRREDDAR